ncbi:hypothetical protein AJ79_04350 [Helicocarpus griseus UAMH5409]|uniref:RRM domain-containing protein n=1 Tax=Helicocarpus griseus UAMH5409 TaxID=1447875 RepID=A0A2B7XKK9_9EURO|nr:hypothetical protein AJ79_04350 [Helicocarpus griseus UAMH5409]
MDRSLDEIIAERPKSSNRGRPRNRPRRGNAPRDGVKKVLLLFLISHPIAVSDWVHDKFEDDNTRPSYRGSRPSRVDRYSPEPEQSQSGAKIRVTNLHYDLTEDDLEDLFTRIGPIASLSLRYDRAGRSEGVAFVTYKRLVDAQTAIREFDGANAKGQPITLMLLSSASERTARHNPFDFAEKPKGSLFDRTEKPRTRDSRSLSPEDSEGLEGTTSRGGRHRRSDVSKPPPDHIDRYVPGQRSPRRRGDGGRGRGRRPGELRDSRDRNGSETRSGRPGGNRRPRKTQEELDQEMEDYWGTTTTAEPNTANGNGNGNATAAADPAPPAADNDIDMIE